MRSATDAFQGRAKPRDLGVDLGVKRPHFRFAQGRLWALLSSASVWPIEGNARGVVSGDFGDSKTTQGRAGGLRHSRCGWSGWPQTKCFAADAVVGPTARQTGVFRRGYLLPPEVSSVSSAQSTCKPIWSVRVESLQPVSVVLLLPGRCSGCVLGDGGGELLS